MCLIAALTTAKFLILRYPFRAASWTTQRAHQLCSLIWASSLTLPILFLIVDKDDVDFDYRQYRCEYGFRSSNWSMIRPMAAFLLGFLPNIVIVATTIPTLKYLIKARKSAQRVQGSVSWQGALTVTLTSAVYCISTLPFISYQFAEDFVGKNLSGSFRVHYYRISNFLMLINIVANFYLYILTIKSFRSFLLSKFQQLVSLPGSVPNPRTRMSTTNNPGNFLQLQDQYLSSPFHYSGIILKDR